MKVLPSALSVLSILVASSLGCAEMPESRSFRQNVPMDPTAQGGSEDKLAASVTVRGHLSSEGEGRVEQGMGGRELVAVGQSVDVLKLGPNGELTPVTSTEVGPGGAFELVIPNDDTGPGLFILQVKNVVGAVVGSGVVNGIPAFLEAFLIDATIDTATSFKTEILVTMAKKGVPGVQNYLNVVNAYVDAQLANSIAVTSVIATDLVTLIGAVSEAVIAANDVLFTALENAGLPIDADAIAKFQSSIAGGIQGLVMDTSGQLITAGKELVASLKAATARAAAPIDQAIFNAIVNGGATFHSKFKSKVSPAGGTDALPFAASKSVFALETELSTMSIADSFKEAGVAENIFDAVTSACEAFKVKVAAAKSRSELEAAKNDFKNVLLGKDNATNGILQKLAKVIADVKAILAEVDATFGPWVKNLADVLAKDPSDNVRLGQMLKQLDEGTKDVPSTLRAAVSDRDGRAINDALRLVEKVIAQ